VIDYKALQFWFMVISAVVNVVVWLGVWITNKDKAHGKDVAAVKCDIQKVDKRVIRLEENKIGHRDLAAVYDRINKVSDQVSEMKGSLDNIGGSVDMILDTLMKPENKS
jgi:archaellum component FlaC